MHNFLATTMFRCILGKLYYYVLVVQTLYAYIHNISNIVIYTDYA